MDFDDFLTKMAEIKEMGFVESHRKGDTGIGKTLEDLLGITENNIAGPGWVVKRDGTLVCKECDFKAERPFKPVRCPNCGREINSLGDALTGHYLGFEEKWEVLCKCYTWVESRH